MSYDCFNCKIDSICGLEYTRSSSNDQLYCLVCKKLVRACHHKYVRANIQLTCLECNKYILHLSPNRKLMRAIVFILNSEYYLFINEDGSSFESIKDLTDPSPVIFHTKEIFPFISLEKTLFKFQALAMLS